jgi:hypothetical protein
MDIKKFSKITVVNLTAICRVHMMLSRLDCQTRASLYAAIMNQQASVQEAINAGADMAIRSGLVKHGKLRERRESESGQGSRKRPRLQKEEVDSPEVNGEDFVTNFKEHVHKKA